MKLHNETLSIKFRCENHCCSCSGLWMLNIFTIQTLNKIFKKKLFSLKCHWNDQTYYSEIKSVNHSLYDKTNVQQSKPTSTKQNSEKLLPRFDESEQYVEYSPICSVLHSQNHCESMNNYTLVRHALILRLAEKDNNCVQRRNLLPSSDHTPCTFHLNSYKTQ